MAPGDRLERVPLVGAVESGDASRLRRPRTAAGYAAGVVALVAVLALASGADVPANLQLSSLGQAPSLGSTVRSGDTCEARVAEATRNQKFYAFDLFSFTPFNVRGEYTRDPPDESVLTAKTTPAEFMYPQWLRAPLRQDKRRVPTPENADLLIMTDNLVDVSPFISKFVWHTGHPEKDGQWTRLDEWWQSVGGDAKGEAVIGEVRNRLGELKKKAQAALGEVAGDVMSLPAIPGTSADDGPVNAVTDLGASRNSKNQKLAFMLPSEWMFLKEDIAGPLQLSAAISDVYSDAITAVTDFDDDGPNVNSVAMTVPFTVHSSIADDLLENGGEVQYAKKKRSTFFKGTGDRGLEGALGKQTKARTVLKQLTGRKGHDVFLSSDKDGNLGNSKQQTKYADGMRASTFCWIPRGDNPTSRRIFDAVAAGCIPVVVSDDIAKYLPFRWAVDWRAMILQVPEAVFAENPKGVADAVLALPDAVIKSLQERLDTARYKLLWNDRKAHDELCQQGKGVGNSVGKEKCSLAPKLYLDEVLYRFARGITDPDAPLCERRKGDDPRFVDGASWTAEGPCPPWLQMHGLCGKYKAE